MGYSIEPRNRIFVKDFCPLLKIWAKISVKIRVKS